jgi:peptide/nickel transport system substrate-binding protein
MSDHSYWERTMMSRRKLLRAGAVGVAGLGAAALIGCGDDDDDDDDDGGGGGGGNGGGGTATATGTSTGGGGNGGASSDLVPPGLAAVYPEIAKYHWSKRARSSGPAKRGGRLLLNNRFDTPTWDTHDPSVTLFNVPMNYFYSRLLRPDLTLDSAFAGKDNLFKLVSKGDLAESWEVNDPTTFTFNIRQNVKWHNFPPVDGRQLTSEDVLYSFEQYVDNQTVGQSAIFRDVESFEAPDDFTFKINMKKPTAYLLSSLTGPLTFVTAREARERPDGLKTDPPIGTGPFVMKDHDFRVKMIMDANPEYFLEGQPYLDGIDALGPMDRSTEMAAFRTGQLDQIGFFSGTSFEDLLETEGWVVEGGKLNVIVQQQNNGGSPGIHWRVDREPFDDIRVRRGLSMGFDRDVLLNTVFGGSGTYAVGFPTDWTALPGKPWPREPKDFGPWYQFDPDEATKLLAAAGADEINVDVLFGSTTGQATGSTADQLQLVQEAWRQLGVDANIKVIDRVALLGSYYGRETKSNEIVGGAPTSAGVDLDDFSYRIMRTGEIANYNNINDPELDVLLDAQQSEFDREARTEIGRKIEDRDLEQVYRLWMTVQLWWEMMTLRTQNFQAHDVYMFSNGWALDQTADTWLDI